jgi:RNA polymerase sigma factor (TIGR02999 family)
MIMESYCHTETLIGQLKDVPSRQVCYHRWIRGPLMDEQKRDFTELLNGADEVSGEELLDQVYGQLKRIAQARMSEERADHTLQATALVHEAYAKLLGNEELSWKSRAHFFNAAAQAMRRILIDHARSKNAIKRGGDDKRIPLGLVDLAQNQDPEEIIALEEAMNTLESEDPRAAQIVSLRFYAGLSVERTALALELSERTVVREWSFARARLFELLSHGKTT